MEKERGIDSLKIQDSSISGQGDGKHFLGLRRHFTCGIFPKNSEYQSAHLLRHIDQIAPGH